MKLQMIALSFFLPLSQFSFATTDRPVCPLVYKLQTVGVSEIFEVNRVWFGAVSANNYDTNYLWTFNIGEFKANDKNDAQQQIISALNYLSFATGPVNDGKGRWLCLYQDRIGHLASTTTL